MQTDLGKMFWVQIRKNTIDELDEVTKNDFAILYARQNEVVSVSRLQRTFRIGYETASSMVDYLESNKYISKPVNFIRRSNCYGK